ncbi:MAG: hypothetical protein AUJ34_01040 [Parcubacteria group bacterium CG1_02_41_12]|nr:MAG: hypothetical protein AUJ34_01040 [Parcubacteria group bacterium CG1_02_41_12]
MKLSPKTGIIISIISAIVWACVFALFYFSTNDYGKFAQADFSQVRGASVQRFELSEDEILIASKSGSGEYKNDRVLLSKYAGEESMILRVIRDAVSVFEQRISYAYTKVEYADDKNYFKILDPISGDGFLLKQVNDEYSLVSLE